MTTGPSQPRTGEPTTATPLVRTLLDFIAGYAKQRVPLEDMQTHVYQQHPALLGDPATRTQLGNAFTAVAATGAITLPVGAKGWEAHTTPALPRWVAKPATAKPEGSTYPTRVWPERLQAAATLATRPDEQDALAKIADWLRDHPNPQPVPMEERSLEIFGYEKALTALTDKRLFITGAITLDLLACHPTPLPLPTVHISGTGPTRLLVCENHAAYYSATTAARRLPDHTRPDLHVAFGGGGQFTVSHAEILFLDPSPTRILYCGDLDWAGLNIARQAATRYAGTIGPGDPALEPASGHYEWLLAYGTEQADPSNRYSADLTMLLTWMRDWFPFHLHAPVTNLLTRRMRISQETVGLDVLTAQPQLITEL
jgi:hypothetical protein